MMLPKLRTPLESAMMLMGCGPSGGGAFDPMSIASMGEWFDFRTVSGSNGNPVSAWAGRKSLYTLTASGTARGTYVIDGDGFPALALDGVDDIPLCYPVSNYALLGPTGDFEIWSVAKVNSVQAGNGYLWFISGQTNSSQLRCYSGATYLRTPDAASLSTLPDVRDDSWKVVRVSKNGSRRLVQINGVTVLDATTSPGTYNSGDDFLVLGNWDDALACSYRHFLTFKAPLDDATAAALTTYLTGAK